LLAISNVGGEMSEPSKYILSYKAINPLNITVDSTIENNYFILLGDWGASSGDKTGVKLQTGVANMMKAFVKSQKSKGKNLLFVGVVGDNFYASGQTCKLWKYAWTDKYGEVASDYPWLAVWGNHDWGKHDPDAMCPSKPKHVDPKTNIPYGANQLNKDKGGCNPSNYYIPDFGYYYAIPELDFEWIAMDKNVKSSDAKCKYMETMNDACEEMMQNRSKHSNASNFMLIQHYAGKTKEVIESFNKVRKQTDKDDLVWAAGGHSHYQQCISEVNGVCEAIQTGGGGHGSPDLLKGFFVIGFDKNKKMVQPYKIDDSSITCHKPCGENITKQDILESNFWNCCHDSDEAKFCHLYDLKKC